MAIIAVAMISATGQILPLAVTSARASGLGVEIVVRNNSSKPITGFCERTERNGMTLRELLPPHQGVLPGASYTELIPFPELSSAEMQRELLSFSISCVASSDGVSGIWPEDVESMSQIRAGRAFQASRLKNFLIAITDSSNDQFQTTVQATISTIAATDITLDDGSQAQGLFASGIRSTNTMFLSRLQQISAINDAGRISELRSKVFQLQQDHQALIDVVSSSRRIRR